jgi:N2227-like protein
VLHFVLYSAGPLLWHFEENTTSDPSIELDLEEVKALAAHIGFEIKVSTLRVCFSFLISIRSFTGRTPNRHVLRQQQGLNARVYISLRLLDGHEEVVISLFPFGAILRNPCIECVQYLAIGDSLVRPLYCKSPAPAFACNYRESCSVIQLLV